LSFGTILISILIFGFLIIIHELGHFIAARATGVEVLEFSVGMGPLLLKKQGKSTLYTLRALPVGGFCKMKGEDADDYSEGSYNSKSKLQRVAILSAGSIMNFIGCILLLIVVFWNIGVPTTIIDEVDPSFPAYEAGVRQEDQVLSINGESVDDWQDVTSSVEDQEQKEYQIEVDREGSTETYSFSSQYDEELGRYRLGIVSKSEKNFFEAIKSGFTQTIEMTRLIFVSLGQLVSGSLSTNDFMGPIGIVGVVGDTVQFGMTAVFNLAALISLNLGIFNLLPIPALDGSRILFVFIEWIKGSPVNPEKEGLIHLIGFALLMVLAIFIAYNDLLRF